MSYAFARQFQRTYAEAKELKGRLTNGKVAIPLWFGMFFLWLNGSYWWPEAWESQTAQAYIILFLFTLVMTKDTAGIWVHQSSVAQASVNCLVGFVVMFAALLIMDTYVFNGNVSGAAISSVAFYPTILLTMVFVAPVEETMFRGVMPAYFKGWAFGLIPLAPVLTSAAFAVTHIMVYGGDVMSIQWAFVMGLVFYGVSRYSVFKGKRLGVPGSTGAHAAYNLFVLGILTGVVV